VVTSHDYLPSKNLGDFFSDFPREFVGFHGDKDGQNAWIIKHCTSTAVDLNCDLSRMTIRIMEGCTGLICLQMTSFNPGFSYEFRVQIAENA